ncbi:DNA ligase D [Virgibacillus xinjiangensis]|uniref:DNA ligase (ATP) n=1 Tax=Virgibacillus xinjiangensis TaxID=393090 RepID=A0ABV7CUE3_9BACI
MDIMKPIPSADMPQGNEWVYEIKYDGFRCQVVWEKENSIQLVSRNNKDLTASFPEVKQQLLSASDSVKDMLPLKLDGELVILNTPYQANFARLQQRGRLKNSAGIQAAAAERPAALRLFDMVEKEGKDLKKTPLQERKELLQEVLQKLGMEGVEPDPDPDRIWKKLTEHKGEGVVAKRIDSLYRDGKNHRDWFKIKNWRTIQGFLSSYHPENGYYTVGVFDQEKIKIIGKCKHGLDADTAATLREIFTSRGEKQKDAFLLPPAICARIHTLDLYQDELREPEFAELLPSVPPEHCTIEQLELDMAMLPESVELTNTNKIFWPEKSFTKGDLLTYIRALAPYMLPFLENRALTVIRCPDGVDSEYFFQKHLPSYAPGFITGIPAGDEQLMVCDNLDALVWFANHGAVEYHIPFQQIKKDTPVEIVFDLDPPDRGKFHLAVKAALLIKPLLDDLGLISFVKTSGNKGLQIHIPIPEESITYQETAVFTQAIAWTVENAHPDLFTTERMKNKRNGRLYIDYVQHGRDKTLIAPYSPRMTQDGTVAAPLFWEEVNEDLDPGSFTLKNTIKRVQHHGCPFRDYQKAGKKQKLEQLMKLIQS